MDKNIPQIAENLELYTEIERKNKLDRYRILNETAKKGEILFTGSSLMEQFPVNELLMTSGINKIIYNQGKGSDSYDSPYFGRRAKQRRIGKGAYGKDDIFVQ